MTTDPFCASEIAHLGALDENSQTSAAPKTIEVCLDCKSLLKFQSLQFFVNPNRQTYFLKAMARPVLTICRGLAENSTCASPTVPRSDPLVSTISGDPACVPDI
jgi:hypothetical protein